MKRLIGLLAVACTACTTTSPTNVHQPMTARPALRTQAPAASGAIFQASTARPLFEDRRARFVGDTVTIKLTENTSASKTANNKLDKSNKGSMAINSITGLSQLTGLGSIGYDVESANSFSGKGEAANKNVFSGSITVTVIDVMPNGNLLVSGEKQLAVGNEQEFVRLSGVINPNFLDSANSVDSSKVADARIEYKSAGQISEGQIMGWLARFFLNVMPF